MLQPMCVLKLKKSISYCEKVPKKNRSPETFHSIWVFHWTVAAHALQAVIGLSVVPRETWILVGGSLTPVTLPVSVDTWYVHIWGFKSHKNPSTSCLALTLLEIILKSWTWYFCILKRNSFTNLVGLTYNIHFLHALSHSTFEVCIRTTRKEWKGHLFQQLDTLESSIHLVCLKPFFKMWNFHPSKPSDIRGLFTHEQTVLCMPQSEPCENFQLELAWDAHA